MSRDCVACSQRCLSRALVICEHRRHRESMGSRSPPSIPVPSLNCVKGRPPLEGSLDSGELYLPIQARLTQRPARRQRPANVPFTRQQQQHCLF